MKYLVPLARANAADCVRLVEAIAPHRLTTRQIGRLYQAYVTGPGRHARAGADRSAARAARHRRRRRAPPCDRTPPAPEALAHRSPHPGRRRAPRRIAASSTAAACCRRSATRAWRLFDQVQTDFRDLQRRCEKELRDARSGTAHGDFELTGEGPRDPPDRPGPADLPGDGADRPQSGQPDGAAD